MVPTQTLENFPPFGDNATKVQPDNAKYAAGFQPSDVYPAEWVNWVWGKSSNGITKLNAGVDMMEREINNVLGGADKTPDATKDNQLLQAIQKLISDAKAQAILAAHPIGSLYWSSSSTDPGTLFGGTWTRIKDKFILAAGDTYTNGGTGGAATVTLQTTQIPSHTHGMNSHTHSVTAAGSVSKHSHGLNSHTHSVGAHSHGLNSHVHTVGAHQHPCPSHNHGMSHYHSRGTMEITGQISNSGGTFGVLGFEAGSGAFSGAFSGTTFSGKSRTGEGGGSAAKVVKFTASSNWTGLTSSCRDENNVQITTTAYSSFSTEYSTAFNSGAATGSTANSTAFNSGAATGNTAETQPTFTGSAVTSGAATGDTGSTGGGGSHENMPPYVVKYCWERTA